MDNRRLAREIMDAAGGRENIREMVHCISRLRLRLKNESLADLERMNQIRGVITAIEDGGQYQIVVGSDVERVHDEMGRLLRGDNEKRQGVAFLAAALSEMFVPLIKVFAGCGLVRGLMLTLSGCGLISESSELYQVLYAASDVIFYCLPVFLGYTAGKTMGADPFVTAVLGAAFLYPGVQESLADLPLFYGLPSRMFSYGGTVLPIIAVSFLAGRINQLLKRVIPAQLQLFVIPAATIAGLYPLTVFAVGPLLNQAGFLLAQVFVEGCGLCPALWGALLGGLWITVVQKGFHWAFVPLFLNNIAYYGYDPIQPLMYGHTFAIAGTMLAAAVMANDGEQRESALACSWSAFLGVTESSLYRLAADDKKLLRMNCAVSAAAGAVLGEMGARYYSAGLSGVFGMIQGVSPQGMSLASFALPAGAVVGFSLAFTASILMIKHRKRK